MLDFGCKNNVFEVLYFIGSAGEGLDFDATVGVQSILDCFLKKQKYKQQKLQNM